MKGPILCLFACLVAGHAAVINWSGADDGTNFNNPTNWIGNVVPGPFDDAVITSGAGSGIVVTSSVTVLSIQCSKAFSVSNGVFAVTAGSSQISGAFTLASGMALQAGGAGTSFTASGPVSADDANFYVSDGAVVALPNLANYTKSCNGAYWTVTGAGSVLNLPGLTNFNGAACSFPAIQAQAGGQLLAPNLASITAGPLNFAADGTNSLIDLSRLTNCSSPTTYQIGFEASAGGTIQMPQLRGGLQISVTLNAGGSIPTAQLTQLTQLTLYAPANCNALTNLTQLTVSGATNIFPSLSNFYDGSIAVLNGASVTLPSLQTFGKNCNGANWTVSGSNSVLNLPALTNITGNACSYPVIQATAGGQLLATNVVSVIAGPLAFQADGAGSLIDLSKLSNCSGQNPYYLTFEASGGGTLRVPNMTGGPYVGLTLNPGGTIPTAQITQLALLSIQDVTNNFNALTNLQSLTSSVTLAFPALTDFTDGNVLLTGGATVTMPALKNYNKICNGANWTVSGSNSLFNLPALTNLTGQACNYPMIQAEAGGAINLSNVVNILAGPLAFQADGTNSLIDLSALVSVSGQSPYQLTFEASSGGTVRLSNMNGGPLTGVILNPGGILPTAQIHKLYSLNLSGQGGNFNALTNLTSLTTGVSINFPALIDFTDGNILVTNGASVTMPALKNYAKICDGGNWTVSGSNSVFNLPALTNITGQACNYPVINAVAGGQVILSNVLSVLAGPLAFQSDGTNSVINLNRLASCSGQNPYQVMFEASAGGTIQASNFVGGPLVGIIVNPGGNLPLAQLRRLFSITANGGAIANLAGLTNLDGGSLSAATGGQIILPALQLVNPFAGCNNASWVANGSGSQIIATALFAFAGSACSTDDIDALAGGQIVLQNLGSLNGLYLHVLADGAGSLINLTNLTSFLSATAGSSSLTAQNSGVILLGTQAFLLQNININIPPGNPILPAVTNSGPSLNLYGTAGHSYLIEQLNTIISGATWQFFLRVPLTNALQQIAGAVPANTAFRITDFVADPPLLDVLKVPVQSVEVVLYGATNKTYELDSATNLTAPVPWISNSVAAMTNAFRIFPPTAISMPGTFFRAKQIAP
jgi:hypothetical protein